MIDEMCLLHNDSNPSRFLLAFLNLTNIAGSTWALKAKAVCEFFLKPKKPEKAFFTPHHTTPHLPC
ncbi:MAG: hypothetical protein R2788_25950 [Saprospiraceae bacterium]